MLSRNFDGFLGCDAPYTQASAVILGAPFDGTTSNRPGARFGPSAMRSESWGLETYSPYQDKDLADIAVFDGGDLELPFGDAGRALDIIEKQARIVLEDGKRLFLLGGEHLVTLGAVRAAGARYEDLHIIHFDAHADLRSDYLGAKLSHACVLRRCWEELGDGRIAQFGIRSGERSEFEWSNGHTKLRKFGFEGLEGAVDALVAQNNPVYLTVDIDVLDCSVLPGTGTPEAGGVSFLDLLRAVVCVFKANVVACDIVELAPGLDASGGSTATACKLLREMLLAGIE